MEQIQEELATKISNFGINFGIKIALKPSEREGGVIHSDQTEHTKCRKNNEERILSAANIEKAFDSIQHHSVF